MHHFTRRLSPSLMLAIGALFLGLAGTASVPASAPAQTAQVAFAVSTAASGMSYSSTDAATTIRVSLANNTFTIDDEVPIQAKAGCASFPATPPRSPARRSRSRS